MTIDTTSPRSRRAILVGALGGAVAAAATAISRASPVDATNGDVMHIGTSHGATRVTQIVASGDTAFKGTSSILGLYGKSYGGVGVTGESDSSSGVIGSSGTGDGLYGASTSSSGVHGDSDTGLGVFGHSHSNHGVYGLSKLGSGVSGSSSSGDGVLGLSTAGYGVHGDSTQSVGVYGTSDLEVAVMGISESRAGVYGASHGTDLPATVGKSYGDSTGVIGHSGPEDIPSVPPKTGVYGVANQDASSVGVRGASSAGRGAFFSGAVAQLRLKPSTAATHPTAGAPGDLFLDTSHRLWFCKGGTVWKQIV